MIIMSEPLREIKKEIKDLTWQCPGMNEKEIAKKLNHILDMLKEHLNYTE